mmetsp:Transcript_26752/g.64175  ORF Transcript_26752/g.64175 Transcript_26752/m.64175 type:complete len:265 (-) Transcript_26752:69-863(-)
MRLTFPLCSGAICLPTKRTLSSSGVTIVGNDGPYTSTSKMPTLAPRDSRAKARFTAVVDFPTPPLHDDTATTAPIWDMPNGASDSGGAFTVDWAENVTSAPRVQSRLLTASWHCCTNRSFTGRQGVVGSRSRDTTLESSIRRFWTKPSETMSESRSGSIITERAESSWDFQSDGGGCFDEGVDSGVVVVLSGSDDALVNRILACCEACAVRAKKLESDFGGLDTTRCACIGTKPETAPIRANNMKMDGAVLIIGTNVYLLWLTL